MANILFLDDEEKILNTYKRMLHFSNIKGFYSKNIVEALKILGNEKIDLIISDYRLEQETGLDFLTQARKKECQVPMVIISGYAEENFIKNAMELNIVQAYLIKPISFEVFNKLINDYLPEEKL
ncbi:MAG: response regulator [Bdellovibrionales bacterium]|nr:response regulator [Bdellovibrionales bacterium]